MHEKYYLISLLKDFSTSIDTINWSLELVSYNSESTRIRNKILDPDCFSARLFVIICQMMMMSLEGQLR